MKIRTDFVTNSSSSSYCISYKLDTTIRKKAISLDLVSEEEDFSNDVYIGSKAEINDLIKQIKECKSVDELVSLLIDNLELRDMFDEESDNDESLSELEDVEIFKKSLSKAKSISDIKTVTIKEYFTGWGEFAREGINGFIETAIPVELDWDDEDSVKDTLKDKFTEDEIDLLIEQIQDDDFSWFEAYIETCVNLKDGSVTKKYGIEAE